MSLLGEELGDGKGLERGVPGVNVSKLTAELMSGLGEDATSVSEEAEVWPVKLMPDVEPGTKSILPLSVSELSPASVDSPSSKSNKIISAEGTEESSVRMEGTSGASWS
jgi:hypothetical protein